MNKRKYNKIAVVIPTYNRQSCLSRLLQQLLSQHFNDYYEIIIVAVVDGSTDGTLEMLATYFSSVHIVEGNGHWWWTRSVNEGILYSSQYGVDAVLLMNDDTEIPPSYLQTLFDDAQLHPGAVIGSINLTISTPHLIYYSGIHHINWWKAKSIRYHPVFYPYEPGLKGVHPSILLLGRGLFIPINVFNVTGLFDQNGLPQYKADFDFTLSAHEHNIPTLISWNAPIFSHIELTGKGATFTHQSFTAFLASFLKKNSYTNLRHSFHYYWKHCPFYLLPLSYTIDKLRLIYSFWQKRKYLTLTGKSSTKK